MPKVAFIAPASNQEIQKYGKSSFEHSIGGVGHLLDADTYFGDRCSNYKELEPYDYVLVNQATIMYQLTIDLRRNLPAKVKVIAFADGAHQDLTRIPFVPDGTLFIKALQASDGFAALVEDAVGYYSLFTDKPGCFLGVPFPYQEVKKYQVPVQQKLQEKWAGINGRLTHVPVRNSIGSLFLTKKAEAVKILLWEIEKDKVPGFLNENNFIGEVHDSIGYTTFYEKYSRCYLGINLDPLGTWGRFSLDMAAMGIPVIGTFAQHTQKKLFPMLTFDPFLEVPKAISAYQRLFSDFNFYNECRNYALHTIETEFTNEKFIARWDNLRRLIDGT